MLENLVFAFLAGLVAVVLVRAAMRAKASSRGAAPAGASPGEMAEALFVSMFPELQPHFHPERLVAYVAARRGRTPARDGYTWKQAPGFDGASVDIRFVKEREECAIVDAAGSMLGRFRFESHPEGGVLRVGAGKLTVDLRNELDPAVRYWHPEREFKWTRRGGWRFTTPVAERPIDSGDRGTSWPESSSSDGVRTAAAAAGIVGLGGTFDGGGASAGWGGALAPDAARDAIDPAGLAAAAVLASGDSNEGSRAEPVAGAGIDAGGDRAGDAGMVSGLDASGDSGDDSSGDSGDDSSGDSGSDSSGDSGNDSSGDSGSDSSGDWSSDSSSDSASTSY
jgi:hypothetical protein